jgi:hypothetical protein
VTVEMRGGGNESEKEREMRNEEIICVNVMGKDGGVVVVSDNKVKVVICFCFCFCFCFVISLVFNLLCFFSFFTVITKHQSQTIKSI